MEQIYVPQFVALKETTRNKLREIFNIPKSSHAEVITDHMGVGTVVCDGTTNIDLQQLTIQKMIDFLGTAAVNESMNDLFKRVVEKIEEPEKIVEIFKIAREEGIKSGILSPEPVQTPETIQTSSTTPSVEKPSISTVEVLPPNDIKADSEVINNVIKCSKCAFETKSNFAMRMHTGKKHK